MDISKFTVDELESFLALKLKGKVDSPESVASIFKHHKIDGSVFLDLLPSDLQEIMPIIGERKAVNAIVESNQECNTTSSTVSNIIVVGAIKRKFYYR